MHNLAPNVVLEVVAGDVAGVELPSFSVKKGEIVLLVIPDNSLSLPDNDETETLERFLSGSSRLESVVASSNTTLVVWASQSNCKKKNATVKDYLLSRGLDQDSANSVIERAQFDADVPLWQFGGLTNHWQLALGAERFLDSELLVVSPLGIDPSGFKKVTSDVLGFSGEKAVLFLLEESTLSFVDELVQRFDQVIR